MKKAVISALAALVLAGCLPDTEQDRRIDALRADNDRLKAQVASLKRAALLMPVTIRFRPALAGPGHVAVIDTVTKHPLHALVTIRTAATGQERQIDARLDGTHPLEIGHLEGHAFDPGDTVTVTDALHTPVTARLD